MSPFAWGGKKKKPHQKTKQTNKRNTEWTAIWIPSAEHSNEMTTCGEKAAQEQLLHVTTMFSGTVTGCASICFGRAEHLASIHTQAAYETRMGFQLHGPVPTLHLTLFSNMLATLLLIESDTRSSISLDIEKNNENNSRFLSGCKENKYISLDG